jgi:putative transposase
MVAEQESKELAEVLIETSCQRQGIDRDQLTLHADRTKPGAALPLPGLWTA